jgi:serine/threonine protein kinase
MGELLLARAASPGGVQKLVAIKRMRAEYASDEEFVAMFLNEARLAATLDHPNVVRTYDLVEEAGGFFMVMEYLHGESLGRLLNAVVAAGERVPLQHIVTIVLGVAAGLHCAHERHGVDGRPLDIVHRDLSPGNVFVTYEGGVKLLDFGIAKATSRTSITIGPSRKGKVAYMSPEQCVGHEVDRRSDVFALGIVMWELSTGRRLYRGDNEFGIMNQITTIDAPSAAAYAPELPAPWVEILERALRRDRDARFQTAMELHETVEAFAGAEGLLPSSTALGRYLEQLCERREYPSVEPSDEFADAHRSTLVVHAPAAEPKRRSLGVILALVGGVTLGAIAVAQSRPATAPTDPASASPTGSTDDGPLPTPATPAAPPSAAITPPTMHATPTADDGDVAAQPAQKRTRRSSPRKKAAAPRHKDEPAKPERGVDGILPSG